MKKVSDFLFEKESYLIRGAAFEIYKKFRNAQKEKIYQRALTEELKTKGLEVESESQIPVYHRNKKIGTYTPDLVINNCILIELKSKPFIYKQDKEQFWQYLKNSDFRLGFLINFGNSQGIQIIRRVYDKARVQRGSA